MQGDEPCWQVPQGHVCSIRRLIGRKVHGRGKIIFLVAVKPSLTQDDATVESLQLLGGEQFTSVVAAGSAARSSLGNCIQGTETSFASPFKVIFGEPFRSPTTAAFRLAGEQGRQCPFWKPVYTPFKSPNVIPGNHLSTKVPSWLLTAPPGGKIRV